MGPPAWGFFRSFPPHVTPRYVLVRPCWGREGCMAYREVTMLEVKEVLRLWLGGAAHKRIAAQLGLNVKTVRRYVAAGRASGSAGRRDWRRWMTA